MSRIAVAFKAKLDSVAAIASALGARIYLDEAESGAAFPYIVYSISDDVPAHDLQGALEVRPCKIHTEIHAVSTTQRATIDELLRNALDGGKNKTWGTANIRTCTIEDSRTDKAVAQNNSQGTDYIQDTVWSVWYSETLPNNL